MACVRTMFSKKIICAGAMSEVITILRREIMSNSFDDVEPTEQLTNIYTSMGMIEEKRPTNRFDNVSIDDNVTHVFYITYDYDVYRLDRNSLFIEFNDRYFKMLSVMNYGESDKYIALFCKETGFTDAEAALG